MREHLRVIPASTVFPGLAVISPAAAGFFAAFFAIAALVFRRKRATIDHAMRCPAAAVYRHRGYR